MLSISSIARAASRSTRIAAARALALMLKSFCETASCRSVASRALSCRTDSSRPLSYRRALVSAMAACAANRLSTRSSRSVNPPGTALHAANMKPSVSSPSDRNAEDISELGVRRGPAPEARILADVREPERLALAQHHRQHPVLPWQRTYRGLLFGGQAIHDELSERATLA